MWSAGRRVSQGWEETVIAHSTREMRLAVARPWAVCSSCKLVTAIDPGPVFFQLSILYLYIGPVRKTSPVKKRQGLRPKGLRAQAKPHSSHSY